MSVGMDVFLMRRSIRGRRIGSRAAADEDEYNHQARRENPQDFLEPDITAGQIYLTKPVEVPGP